jgi:hypothetical protein
MKPNERKRIELAVKKAIGTTEEQSWLFVAIRDRMVGLVIRERNRAIRQAAELVPVCAHEASENCNCCEVYSGILALRVKA